MAAILCGVALSCIGPMRDWNSALAGSALVMCIGTPYVGVDVQCVVVGSFRMCVANVHLLYTVCIVV